MKCSVVDMYGCMPADVHSFSVTEHWLRSCTRLLAALTRSGTMARATRNAKSP
jgi:hypothetical protein